MKKLITTLSALTITTTIVPTIVACGKNETKLDIESLNEESFKQLDTIVKPTSSGGLLGGLGDALGAGDVGSSIETKNINDINSDQDIIKAIKDHIKVITLKKVFGLNDLVKTSDNEETFTAFTAFWGLLSTKPLLNIDVKVIEPNKQYKVIITKEKWRMIQITGGNEKVTKILKSGYDSIKGEKTTITITK